MATITIASGQMFSRGVANARKVGGRFDGRTWTLPDTAQAQAMLRAPGVYGWRLVRPVVTGTLCPRCHTVCDGDCHA
jgi:hypothetical protein